jgi:hypothetical protein
MADYSIVKLLRHAETACKAALGPEVSASVSISAYTGSDDLPEHFPVTHEYIVQLDFSSVPELITDASERLVSFLGKNIYYVKGRIEPCLFWGEGERLDSIPLSARPKSIIIQIEEDIVSASAEPLIKWMKSDTILPKWLDCLLFDSLGARYEPDWDKFSHNLNLTKDELKVYLGTYFPRSYAEAFCIFDALFNSPSYAAEWRSKTEASILDIGTGTGGNLAGLLTALAKHCPNLNTVTVHGYDGNQAALSANISVLDSLVAHVPFELRVLLTQHHLVSLNNLPMPQLHSYDFITTFKTGGEIISSCNELSIDFYNRFLTLYANLLSTHGLLVLLDVTTKSSHRAFLPQLINEQASHFIRNNSEFTTLIPVPCYLHEARCSGPCFTQKEFIVTHRAARGDRSRVAYRVVARNECAEAFHSSTRTDAMYITCRKATNETSYTCQYSSKQRVPLDGFRMSHD